MVAAMGLVTGSTVLRNRRMFKCEGTSLFRVALVTKIRGRIGPYHLGAKSAMRRMATGAFNFTFLDGMA